jgi:hypothetical protein
VTQISPRIAQDDSIHYSVCPHGVTLNTFSLPDSARTGVTGTDYHVTKQWVQACVNCKHVQQPDKFLEFAPLPYACPIEGSSSYKICVSGFVGPGRLRLIRVIELLGATAQETLSKSSTTTLICKKPEGDKYKRAVAWKIPVVSQAWLDGALKSGVLPKLDRGANLATVDTSFDGAAYDRDRTKYADDIVGDLPLSPSDKLVNAYSLSSQRRSQKPTPLPVQRESTVAVSKPEDRKVLGVASESWKNSPAMKRRGANLRAPPKTAASNSISARPVFDTAEAVACLDQETDSLGPIEQGAVLAGGAGAGESSSVNHIEPDRATTGSNPDASGAPTASAANESSEESESSVRNQGNMGGQTGHITESEEGLESRPALVGGRTEEVQPAAVPDTSTEADLSLLVDQCKAKMIEISSKCSSDDRSFGLSVDESGSPQMSPTSSRGSAPTGRSTLARRAKRSEVDCDATERPEDRSMEQTANVSASGFSANRSSRQKRRIKSPGACLTKRTRKLSGLTGTLDGINTLDTGTISRSEPNPE